MIPPWLFRSRYQFAQQMSSEAVRLSAENKYWSMKPRPLSIADFHLFRTHVVLVQASISSLHHEIFVYVSATFEGNVPLVNVSPAVFCHVPERL